MEENKHKTILFNKHLLIDTIRGVILIDTGSPVSFHKHGCIEINGREYSVPANYMGISATYISNTIGLEVSGLLGMDIINLYEVWIDVRNVAHAIGDVWFFCPDESKPYKGANVMGIPICEVEIGGSKVKLLFDTGAPISYLSDRYIGHTPIHDEVRDFSPLMGGEEYVVHRHVVPSKFRGLLSEDEKHDIAYGQMPTQLSMLLNMLNVDGIIGYDLIERFRVVVVRGELYFPPQGI
jgi:hypothetical protein